MKLKSLILFGLLSLSFLFVPIFSPVQAATTTENIESGLEKVLDAANKKGNAGTVLRNFSNPEDK